ncbi:hypothetical protein [Mangrovicoccus sp. HB161399]|uniref:hypothetical protein n=1 Tax=Mangrovicoccus sp. HB161399 TaxID=2720392 RepID=UPI0015577151|nr:hypothetical protein [Mangrovicoccus sp. HB161399]
MVVPAKRSAERYEIPGLQGVGQIEASRGIDGRTTSATRFFAPSRLPALEVFLAAVRAR